jgi:hypothetical protein
MSALANVRRLRRVAHWIAGKGSLEEGDVDWLRSAIADYLDRAPSGTKLHRAPSGTKLDLALWLKTGSGNSHWWNEDKRG